MRRKLLVSIVLLAFLILRLPSFLTLNSYADYDEGTYLLIARLINHGYLPYGDVFAVHPPLYYYLLALWLRVFGDSYLVGRALSLVLGILSVVVAYYTGREAKNERLGIAFALLIVLDPLMVRMNSLVYHETLIELFTLLSMLYLIKYLQGRRIKYAIFSLFFAGLGSSAKFTIIPYLLAVFTLIILYESEGLRRYIHAQRYFVTFKQGTIILLSYLIWTALSITFVTMWPDELTRIVMSVPGIHAMNRIGHIYTSLLFVTLWLVVTVYVFRISYLKELGPFFRELLKEAKAILLFTSVVVLSKAIVEVPLGIAVSQKYIEQTYLAQSHRGYPFMDVFILGHKILTQIQNASMELLAPWLPLMLLLSFLLLWKARGGEFKTDERLNALMLLNFIFYLLLIPLIPDPRFLYPFILTAYLALLYPFTDVLERVEPRKAVGIALALLLILGITDTGMAVNYPRGLLKVPHAVHDKELRNDLGSYIRAERLEGTYLAINPMDAYYLNLSVVPYLVDTFGLGYLKDQNLVKLVREYRPDYIIFSTWMFGMMEKSKDMMRIYGTLFNYSVHNGTLLFGEAFSNGENVQLYHLGEETGSEWSIYLDGTVVSVENRYGVIVGLSFMFNGSKASRIRVWKISNSTYGVIVDFSNGEARGIVKTGESVSVNVPKTVIEVLTDGPVYQGTAPLNNETVNEAVSYTPKGCVLLKGLLTGEGGRVTAREGHLEIASGCGDH